jgi:hypothetical protein
MHRSCAALVLGIAPLLGAGPKDHVLFMGTDLAVQKGDSFLRVQDVSGSAFMVKVGAEPEFVPTRMRSANIKIERALKLSATRVQVDNLRGDRTFTPENDPRLKFDRQTGAASGAQAAADLARYQANELRLAAATARAHNDPRADELERMLAKADELERIAMDQLSSDATNIGAAAAKLQGAMRDGDFDAMEVEFEISAEREINDAYIVIISRFREKGSKPGVSRNWIYAKSIGEIGPKPRYLRIREGGFPFGFILEDYELHVYDRGRELASNVSPKRVELSREEALQYLLIEHLAANKDQTVPAAPAAGRLPPDLTERLTQGFFLQPYYVKVDEAGNPRGVFTDATCKTPVTDPYLTDLFAGLLFKPALVAGMPAAAVCRVKLPELRL